MYFLIGFLKFSWKIGQMNGGTFRLCIWENYAVPLKSSNFQVIFLNIYSAIFHCSHLIVAYKEYNAEWEISVYESVIYSFSAFNEAFESRPHNSFVMKSLSISWRNFF